MKKEDWEKVNKALKTPFRIVTLKCDEYQVALTLQQISDFKLGIMVYVNGTFRGQWVIDGNSSEEARRFLPTHYRARYSAKDKKIYKNPRIFGKKYLKDHGIDLDEKIEHKGFYWTSVGALKRHFIANNQSIELVEIVP